MSDSFYRINLGAFAIGNALLLYRRYYQTPPSAKLAADEIKAKGAEDGGSPDDDDEEEDVLPTITARAEAFRRDFFVVYGLAVAADWLQGPHIYAIYKYEKGIPERMVAALYASGFISGAVSASFVGQLADRYGRRLACSLYCVLYILTCMSMLSDNLAVLLLGRLCGGVSTTLLYCVFEAWMITEYHKRRFQYSKLTLSSIFSHMTTFSCIIGIGTGVLGDVLVSSLGGRVWPFIASIVCSFIAMYCIWSRWDENYGTKSVEHDFLGDLKSGFQVLISNKRVLALGIASCFFEGSMYLMIFFWSAALKSARAGTEGDLPFGIIFSCFMCAMMAGSSVFSLYTARHTQETTSFILMGVVLVASACLSGAIVFKDHESLLFWALCLFEMCIGSYFPSMSFLKSDVVEDGVRGKVYSILRFPLNVFVVVVHSLDEEGDAHRNSVFLTCAALLMASAYFIRRNFSEQLV